MINSNANFTDPDTTETTLWIESISPRSNSFQEDITTRFLYHILCWMIIVSSLYLILPGALYRWPQDACILLSLPTTFLMEQNNEKQTQPIITISNPSFLSCWYFMLLIYHLGVIYVANTCIQFLIHFLAVPFPSTCGFFFITISHEYVWSQEFIFW